MTAAKMVTNTLIAFSCFIVCISAAKSPALIWSSSRPLGDLPLSYAGKTVNTDSFHGDFLKPLTSNKGQHLVVFLQDKLSLEDFTNHADVYNPNSDGGSFKNVKTTMDDQYSVQLPAVTNPHDAIETLSKDFPGQVVRVDNPDKLESVELKDGQSYLIIVHMMPTIGKDEAKAFQVNDEAIGKCMHNLNKRGVKYSAIYTGMTSSQVASGELYQGRHLLEVVNYDTNGTFFKDANIMMFYKYINLTVYQSDSTEPKSKAVSFKTENINVSSQEEGMKNNRTIKVTMNMNNKAESTGKLEMVLRTTPQYEWAATNATLTYKNTNESMYDFEKMPVNLGISATLNWCYHCTKLVAKPVVRGYNNTKKQTISLVLNGFQLQAFTNITGNFTDNVWDCVEFFTIPIWMGIITTLVLVMILFFGMTMIANITTMDRFDDPKGKTITVTVNE